MARRDDVNALAREAEDFWEKGDYENAHSRYTAATIAFLRLFPGDLADPYLLDLKLGAARCLENLGRLKECIVLNCEVLNEQEKSLKPTDADLLVLRETLALNNTQLGKHTVASSLLRTNLKVLGSPDYGPEHEWTLQTMYSLAIELSSLSKYQQALALLEKTLHVMAAKSFPQERQDMVEASIKEVQEAISQRAVKVAEKEDIRSDKFSGMSEVKTSATSKHQETTTTKRHRTDKEETPPRTSKSTPRPSSPLANGKAPQVLLKDKLGH